MILKELKFAMTSLGTPSVVNMVPKKLAAWPIPLSLRYWIGKKQKIPAAWNVRRTSSTKSSFHRVGILCPRAAATDGLAGSQNPCLPIFHIPPDVKQMPKTRKTLGRSLPPGGKWTRRFRIQTYTKISTILYLTCEEHSRTELQYKPTIKSGSGRYRKSGSKNANHHPIYFSAYAVGIPIIPPILIIM